MERVTVVAELGINHNGSANLACELASMAKTCGADAVKLQLRDVESCYSSEDLAAPCRSPWGSTVGDKVRGRELSWSDVDRFNAHCAQIGLKWSASCFDHVSLRELHRRFPRRPFNKVPSGMAISSRRPFLEEVAAQRILTLVSTGLCRNLDEVGDVARVFEFADCPFVLNHCVALYPCPQNRLNVLGVSVLLKMFGGMRWLQGVGYSGHETGILPSVLAVQLGATYVERHITLDRASYGADQAASLEAEGLRRLVRDVRAVRVVLGDGEKRLRGDEKQPVGRYVAC